ncbi:MAG TPA: PKD domain-containing protein [Gemmatimonadales bacterium]|nr:PKD domain-containing protein [Gemmatimonadales bacterium]
MKTCYVVGLVALVVGCHLDKLLTGPPGGNQTSDGPVTGLVFATGPANGRAGQPLPAFRVALVDAAGRTVATADSLITIAFGNNPANATLSGTNPVRAVSGVATFSDLRIDSAASGYTLKAQAAGPPPVTSPAFAVMPGAPTVLRFTVQPSNTMQNSVITPAVKVTAYDAFNNAATNFTGTIVVAKGIDGSVGKNAKLGGTTSVNAVAGVATFADLTIDQPGTGYTIIAAFGSAADTSATFDIRPPPPGSLTVTTNTSGKDLDPDGYTVAVDDTASKTITTNGTVTFTSLSPGSHTVVLSGLAANCSVTGGSASRSVTIQSNGAATLAFNVTCSATTGSITVTTATTGGSQPSGYTVAVDGGGGSSQPIGASTSVTFSGLTPGSHTVTLTGVPSNCTVANGTSQALNVTAGNDTPASFSISCTALPGDLVVSTHTSGASIPTSSYTVTLDQTTPRSIGTTDNTTFTALTPGNHAVVLSGVPGNCTVTNGTTRMVNVPSGSSATATYDITCTALPGSITVGTTTTGSNLPSGYTVTLDAATSQPIGINDNVTFNNVPASSHSVVLSGVPTNCTVTNGDTRSVTVPAGGSASAAFTISCAAPTGNLKVTASTTGANLPTSGYTVTVDGTSQSISINGNVTFGGLTPGSHTAVLSGVPGNCTVTNGSSQTANVPSGGTATVGFTITCTAPPNQPPVAQFTSSCTQLSCNFTSTSNDPDGSITAYSWTFGDGGTANTQNPSHTYAAGGTFTVTLTVTDNQNATGSISHQVTVTAPPPPTQPPVVTAGPDQSVLVSALFSLSGAGFTDPDHDGPWTVTIDWGDGSSPTTFGMNSEGSIGGSHSYPLTLLGATYTLRVTVTDSHGNTGSATKTVKVIVT